MGMPVLYRLPGVATSPALKPPRRIRNSLSRLSFQGTSAQRDVLAMEKQNVRIGGANNVPLAQAHLAKLRELQAYAQKVSQFYPNYSKRHYGALVVLDNGIEAMGTNVEASRQLTFCDLRYAITHAMNQSIATVSPSELGRVAFQPKVKTIYLVNADMAGAPPVPCSDCQEWLGSPLCPPDTTIVSLEKDPQRGANVVVRLRTVRDMLPLHKARLSVRMVTDLPLASLPMQMSQFAERRLLKKDQPVSLNKLRQMLAKAQDRYLQNARLSADSGLKTGACVMLSPFESLIAADRFDWSTRWHEPADLHAVAKAFAKAEVWQKPIRRITESKWCPALVKNRAQLWLKTPKIQAVAYYGEDSQLPPIASLGRMARRRGSCETLVVMVENNVIQVRTVADFMPEMYQTKTVSQLQDIDFLS